MQTSSVAAKVRYLFGLCKDFEEKMCKVSAKKASLLVICRAAAIFMQKKWRDRGQVSVLPIFSGYGRDEVFPQDTDLSVCHEAHIYI